MIGLKWSGVTRSDQSCMKHDGIKFRVNYFAHRARIFFILRNSLLISTAKTFYHPQRRRSVNIIIVNVLFPRIKFDANTPFESAVAPKSLQGRTLLS